MTGISVERRAELRALAGDTIECALAPDLAASGIAELLDEIERLDSENTRLIAGQIVTVHSAATAERDRLSARVAELEQQVPPVEVTHNCPLGDSGVTPCCGRSPFVLPRTDRITVDPALVTCPDSHDTDEESR